MAKVSVQLPRKTTDLALMKRDGRVVPFEIKKIAQVLLTIEKEIYGMVSKEANEQIEQILEEINYKVGKEFKESLHVSNLQAIIEEVLIQNNQHVITERYARHRADKETARKNARDINYTINELLDKDKNLVNENANKDSDVFNTQRDLTAGLVAKSVGLQLLPEHVANAHQKGDIHYHDLDYTPYTPMTNCCLIDFEGMFSKGFKIGNAEVESPKSIQTAAAQTAQIIANVASTQYGGCSFDRIDEVLAPYALLNYEKNQAMAKEWIDDSEKREAFVKEKTKKDIYDAMQSLEYEINTLFSSQGQTPFTTLGFGLGTNWLEREIQKAILTVRIGGLGKEKRTAIFPKLVFTLKRGVNLESTDPNYDIKELALECSTKRMYPDIVNYEKIVELTGSFKSPMGCRSFLQDWQDEQGNEITAGRMNLGVVTLNLPRIALETSGNMERFWQKLDERLAILKDGLLFKAARVTEAKPENAPILYQHGAFGMRLDKGEDVEKNFENRRATVSLGYIGLYETAAVFYGPTWESNPEAKEFTLAILKRLKEAADAWSDEIGYHFSVYSTPSESLTDRFCRLDQEKFGIIDSITDKDYYTNSFHYDVRKNPTPFEKIEFEKDYPEYCAGGFIHYCEYPKLHTNPKALEAVWDFSYDRVGYLGTNTPIDHCYECEFDGEFLPTEYGFKCPNCGNTDPKTSDVVKRTCGYLGNPQERPMVHGRHQEIKSRVKHMKGSIHND